MNASLSSYSEAAERIVKEQEAVIGPLAFDQARKVAGLTIAKNGHIELVGNAKDVLTHLVQQYEHLFGQASVEVCKDAVREVKPPISSEDLPEILK